MSTACERVLFFESFYCVCVGLLLSGSDLKLLPCFVHALRACGFKLILQNLGNPISGFGQFQCSQLFLIRMDSSSKHYSLIFFAIICCCSWQKHKVDLYLPIESRVELRTATIIYQQLQHWYVVLPIGLKEQCNLLESKNIFNNTLVDVNNKSTRFYCFEIDIVTLTGNVQMTIDHCYVYVLPMCRTERWN